MVELGHPFDANQHEPTQAFDLIPAGWYGAYISNSEARRTKDGVNTYLWLMLELMEAHHPQHKGRKLWDRLHLWHTTSQEAVRIAHGTLSAISRAVGVMVFENTEALHGLPMAVRIKIRPADGNYDATNEVTGYDLLEKRIQIGSPQQRETVIPGSATSPGMAHERPPMQPGPTAGGSAPPPHSAAPPPTQAAPQAAPPAASPQGQPGQDDAPPWQR